VDAEMLATSPRNFDQDSSVEEYEDVQCPDIADAPDIHEHEPPIPPDIPTEILLPENASPVRHDRDLNLSMSPAQADPQPEISNIVLPQAADTLRRSQRVRKRPTRYEDYDCT